MQKRSRSPAPADAPPSSHAAPSLLLPSDAFALIGGQSALRQPLHRSCLLYEHQRGWRELPPLLPALPRGVFGASAALAGARLVAVGGCTTPGAVRVAHAAALGTGSTAWTPLPDMLQARFGAGTAVCKDLLIVAGGCDGGKPLKTVEALALGSSSSAAAAATWAPLAPMTVARYSFSAATVGSLMYAVGGSGAGGRALRDVEALDLESPGIWKTMPPLATARRHCSSTASADGTVWVAGGCGATRAALSSVERLRPKGTAWEAAPAMRQAREWPVLLPTESGGLLAIGGRSGDRFLCDAEFLPLNGSAWQPAPEAALPAPRVGAAAIVVGAWAKGWAKN
jgi:hypothetical protein